MITWTPPSSNGEHAAREVLSAAMWMHTTFVDEVWLWRGQARKQFGIEPGMHTRVLNAQVKDFPHTEETVERATARLLEISRLARLDQQGETTLPDLAMLAHLQHYGAGTPLLDVSTDPLIALWMIAFANAKDPGSLDDESGVLFGIRKPQPTHWISPLDARPYSSKNVPSISQSLGEDIWWYQAPDVTERLRIQRGSFLLGALCHPQGRTGSTIPLNMGSSTKNWLETRMTNRGDPSNTTHAKSDAFRIIVRGSLKEPLRKLLEERSGLSVEAVYPTPWHRPFISQFAEGYGRSRALELDIAKSISGVGKKGKPKK